MPQQCEGAGFTKPAGFHGLVRVFRGKTQLGLLAIAEPESASDFSSIILHLNRCAKFASVWMPERKFADDLHLWAFVGRQVKLQDFTALRGAVLRDTQTCPKSIWELPSTGLRDSWFKENVGETFLARPWADEPAEDQTPTGGFQAR